MAEAATAQFSIGQVVQHKMFGYRGLVFDVDPVFSHDEDWYESMASTHPPKDRPWYHVLVDGADHVTYVAERNLTECTDSDAPIDHPLLNEFFSTGRYGHYSSRLPYN